MYKIAILGCENSHANHFLDIIIKDKKYSDVEVCGVYSDDKEAADKLHEEYGVYVASSYDEFCGKADGVVITARHGDNHYKYAKPYIPYGIPMFIDKPITASEKDANAFWRELKENNISVSGGSVCVLSDKVKELKGVVRDLEQGEVFGGFLRAPVNLVNEYGNFSFYSQHMVQVMCEIFGFYPNSVKAYKNGSIVTVVVRYRDYDVTLEFTDGSYTYWAYVSAEKGIVGSEYKFDGCFVQEFEEYYDILSGKAQKHSYEDFFAPVFIICAIERSMESGEEVLINRLGE